MRTARTSCTSLVGQFDAAQRNQFCSADPKPPAHEYIRCQHGITTTQSSKLRVEAKHTGTHLARCWLQLVQQKLDQCRLAATVGSQQGTPGLLRQNKVDPREQRRSLLVDIILGRNSFRLWILELELRDSHDWALEIPWRRELQYRVLLLLHRFNVLNLGFVKQNIDTISFACVALQCGRHKSHVHLRRSSS